jgi:tetratricopeptide (TPR) repeat protein
MSIWLAQSRLAGPVAAAAEAKAYLAGRSPASGAEFSFTTLRYLAGDLSEAQFIAAGENPSKGKHVGSAMFYAGMKHVAEGDATGAAPLFRRGIEQPNNSSGYTYFNAVLELDRIASASAKPPVPPSPLSSGNSRDDAWRLCNTAETPADAAIAACTTILNSGSESVKNTAAGLFRRGMAYVAKSEDDRALGDLAGSIALDGANAGALQGRATIYIRKKQFDLAIEDLSRALSTDPKSTGALTLRGAAYLGKSQNYQALADYNAALAIVPQAAGALYGRGVVKQRTGDATGGQADIDAAVRLDKNVASEQGRLGLAPGR